jgi:hypothetical protein
MYIIIIMIAHLKVCGDMIMNLFRLARKMQLEVDNYEEIMLKLLK